jgi:hypothetical protein
VPNLIAFGKMPEEGFVQKSVGVGKEPDTHDSWYRRAAMPLNSGRQCRSATVTSLATPVATNFR